MVLFIPKFHLTQETRIPSPLNYAQSQLSSRGPIQEDPTNGGDVLNPTTNEFVAALHSLFRQATLRGDPSLTVNAGRLHRLLGGYSGTDHRMPSCCKAMYKMKTPDDQY